MRKKIIKHRIREKIFPKDGTHGLEVITTTYTKESKHVPTIKIRCLDCDRSVEIGIFDEDFNDCPLLDINGVLASKQTWKKLLGL
jgi:hypothetical protein